MKVRWILIPLVALVMGVGLWGARSDAAGTASQTASAPVGILRGSCGGDGSNVPIWLQGLGQTEIEACGYVFSSSAPPEPTPMPVAGVLNNLTVAQFEFTGNGTATLWVNGVPTLLSCSIGANQVCHDSSHPIQVKAGDLVAVQVVPATVNDFVGDLSASLTFASR